MPWFKLNIVSPMAYFTFPSATMRFLSCLCEFVILDNLTRKITHQDSTFCKECVKQLTLGEEVNVTNY